MIKSAILLRVRPSDGWLLRVVAEDGKVLVSKTYTDKELLALLQYAIS